MNMVIRTENGVIRLIAGAGNILTDVRTQEIRAIEIMLGKQDKAENYTEIPAEEQE